MKKNIKRKYIPKAQFTNVLILAITSHFNGEVVPLEQNIKRSTSIKNGS
jgi:hypothetical protein